MVRPTHIACVVVLLCVIAVVANFYETPSEQSIPHISSSAAISTGASEPLRDHWPTLRSIDPGDLRVMDMRSAANDPVIGSEGFGPHIEEALQSRDARRAMQAHQWLVQCKVNGELADGMRSLRSRPDVPQPAIAEQIVEIEAVARRCQTVTPAIAALDSDLTQLAMRGDQPGAAVVYAESAWKLSLSADEKSELLHHLQVAARQEGDVQALRVLGGMGNLWGLPESEARLYASAYRQLVSSETFLRMSIFLPELRHASESDEGARKLAELVRAKSGEQK